MAQLNAQDMLQKLAKRTKTASGSLAKSAQDAVTALAKGAQEASIVAADGAQKAANAISEGAKEAAEIAGDSLFIASKMAQRAITDLRLAYYKPVTPTEYNELSGSLPRLIAIEDPGKRKEVDVCEGAIGWLSKNNDMDVLHLYSEFVAQCGLDFYPAPVVDSIYLRDHIDFRRFIDVSCFMEVAQSDRITELKQIAYKLGAKRCRLEMHKQSKTATLREGGLGGKIIAPGYGNVSRNESASLKRTVESMSETLFEQTFEGSANPIEPELHWFAHDKEMLDLIKTRCSADGTHTTKEYHMRLNKSTTMTLSVTAAEKIDGAIKQLGATCDFTLKSEAQEESRSLLDFYIEF